jgi:hypothetical protein
MSQACAFEEFIQVNLSNPVKYAHMIVDARAQERMKQSSPKFRPTGAQAPLHEEDQWPVLSNCPIWVKASTKAKSSQSW